MRLMSRNLPQSITNRSKGQSKDRIARNPAEANSFKVLRGSGTQGQVLSNRTSRRPPRERKSRETREIYFESALNWPCRRERISAPAPRNEITRAAWRAGLEEILDRREFLKFG